MADVVSLLPVLELVEDFEEINDIMDDDDDIVVFSAVSCFMRRNLTRISGYFEQTVPRYLPDEFRQHFRMTRETCEMPTEKLCKRDIYLWETLLDDKSFRLKSRSYGASGIKNRRGLSRIDSI